MNTFRCPACGKIYQVSLDSFCEKIPDFCQEYGGFVQGIEQKKDEDLIEESQNGVADFLKWNTDSL